MSWGYDLLIDAKRNSLWRWATRFTLKRSAALVADCDTIRQEAIQLGMTNERIVTFPWGIDLDHFSADKENDPDNLIEDNHPPFTLLSTRAWEPIYGVENIARAFVKAAQQRPELRLIMLGNGSEAALLHQIYRRAGLLGDHSKSQEGNKINRVVFPGQIGFQELPRYYRAADLYIAASHSDGTSISLLEAMACGCPALVSDIPGNREWVTPGKNGWLFPQSDVGALADAILNAVDQPQHLLEMGQFARRVTEERANWKQNFPKLLDAFDIALQDQ